MRQEFNKFKFDKIARLPENEGSFWIACCIELVFRLDSARVRIPV